MSTRLRLRRADGRIYLDRWGFEVKALGGIFLHRMQGADPGEDLHDHPWWFVSIPLLGGYLEERAEIREAPEFAYVARAMAEPGPTPRVPGIRRGHLVERRPRRWRTMRLDEAHRIVELTRHQTWTLVVHGPTRRRWGFYLPSGWMPWRDYELSDEGRRRELRVDITNVPDEAYRVNVGAAFTPEPGDRW